MIVKSTIEVSSFVAGDATLIKELLHPKNEAVEINYSLAHAELAIGEASKPHILEKQSELYYILEGEGKVHIGDDTRVLQKGDFALVPKGIKQHIVNIGKGVLSFLCIVSPPWSSNDEVVL